MSVSRRGFLKFVLGSAVAVGLPWKRFEWREPTFTEIVTETLRRRQAEVARSNIRSNRLYARLVEGHLLDAVQRAGIALPDAGYRR